MEMMSQPLEWEVSNGSIIGVETPETLRAGEMKAMYDQLNEEVEKGTNAAQLEGWQQHASVHNISYNFLILSLITLVQTRIELLERIKALSDSIDHCGLAKDVSGLLERELQMLHEGTDLGPEFMDGMRKRLSNQFTKLVTRLNSDASNGTPMEASSAKFQIRQPSW